MYDHELSTFLHETIADSCTLRCSTLRLSVDRVWHVFAHYSATETFYSAYQAQGRGLAPSRYNLYYAVDSSDVYVLIL